MTVPLLKIPDKKKKNIAAYIIYDLIK